MTSYFDKAHTDLRAARRLDTWEMLQAFDAIESLVVYDCTLAALTPGFPEDLRKNVHAVVLKYGVTTLPCNAPPADFETSDDHLRRLGDLVWHLHSVFHDVAHRGLDGFSDSPTFPLRRIYALGEEEREKMVAEDPTTATYSAEYMARMKAEQEKP